MPAFITSQVTGKERVEGKVDKAIDRADHCIRVIKSTLAMIAATGHIEDLVMLLSSSHYVSALETLSQLIPSNKEPDSVEQACFLHVSRNLNFVANVMYRHFYQQLNNLISSEIRDWVQLNIKGCGRSLNEDYLYTNDVREAIAVLEFDNSEEQRARCRKVMALAHYSIFELGPKRLSERAERLDKDAAIFTIQQSGACPQIWAVLKKNFPEASFETIQSTHEFLLLELKRSRDGLASQQRGLEVLEEQAARKYGLRADPLLECDDPTEIFEPIVELLESTAEQDAKMTELAKAGIKNELYFRDQLKNLKLFKYEMAIITRYFNAVFKKHGILSIRSPERANELVDLLQTRMTEYYKRRLNQRVKVAHEKGKLVLDLVNGNLTAKLDNIEFYL